MSVEAVLNADATTILQHQDLAALLEVTRALSRESNLDRLLELITAKATEVIDADRSTLFLYDAKSGELWSKIAQKLGSDEIRFPIGVGIAGTVAHTLQSEIVTTPYQDPRFNAAFDRETGYRTRSILCVPVLDADNKLLGVIQVLNKNDGQLFDQHDESLLEAFASHAAVALERGQAQEALALAHNELQSLYDAKTKMINHLSHELKTPLSVISASLQLLRKKTADAADSDNKNKKQSLQRMFQRIERNLQRLLDLENEAQDIAQSKTSARQVFLLDLIQETSDHLACIGEHGIYCNSAAAQSAALTLSHYIEDFFQPDTAQEKCHIKLRDWIPSALSAIAPLHEHRHIDLRTEIATDLPISIPESPLHKTFVGLVRNAIENTSDGGHIVISVVEEKDEICLRVQDFETGISEAFQQQLFHGMVHAEDTDDYSSRSPYEFKAGGKGLDLLRTRLFAERYGFEVRVLSEVGKGSCFTLAFPPARETDEA